jgi:nicotinate dehydrogenase subunit A
MIMATKALLDRNAHPSDAEIKQALKYHLCRCGTHVEILDAVRRARDATAPSPQSP